MREFHIKKSLPRHEMAAAVMCISDNYNVTQLQSNIIYPFLFLLNCRKFYALHISKPWNLIVAKECFIFVFNHI